MRLQGAETPLMFVPQKTYNAYQKEVIYIKDEKHLSERGLKRVKQDYIVDFGIEVFAMLMKPVLGVS